MRVALFTLVPMLVAAVLVMVGGERLARRDHEQRIPLDRERLYDFSELFRVEVERLESVYEDHLIRLSNEARYLKEDELKALADDIVGIQDIRLFTRRFKDEHLVIYSSGSSPEIELEGRKKPLNPDRSLVIDEGYLTDGIPIGHNWLRVPGTKKRVFCYRPSDELLVALLLDYPVVQTQTNGHLSEWMDVSLIPLKEAGERISVTGSNDSELALLGLDRYGPAAAIIPIRSSLGEWQVMAWDGITVSKGYDQLTIVGAAIVALFLAAAGLWLFIEQRRALRLAGERVSFVNRVSHELGTPLTNVLLNLDLARETLETRPANARKRLSLVNEEVERLARLVANVLTFSRRERDTLVITPVPCVPGTIVSQTLEGFRPALERRGIEIEAQVSAEDSVMLDPDALSQITGNLISNVEKYAFAGRSLRLNCEIANEQLSLRVSDRGPGIPESQRSKVFEPFMRVSDRTNEGSSGTGLGLSISRDLARRMGGSLELLESEQGSIFCLKLPAPPTLVLLPESKIAQ